MADSPSTSQTATATSFASASLTLPPETTTDVEALRTTAAVAIRDYVEACIAHDLNPQLAIMGLIAEITAAVA